IILGFIWGIWHLPLCFMLYSPSTPIYCVISHIGYCILLSIFFGFVYMKTRNLWSVIIIHLINNSMVIDDSSAYGKPISLKDLILSLIFCTIVFLPFLFTKEYKGKMSRE
ncbi:CPBP family intramembrane glutamic endopeptidase, partial [Clostridium sp. CF012]|uniref:CPBP family intramembrane glutamic endopeptidase n=1 Tax=Clostridium sp. CF012 TaxID=2843319 RepID=UPI001C0DEE4D